MAELGTSYRRTSQLRVAASAKWTVQYLPITAGFLAALILGSCSNSGPSDQQALQSQRDQYKRACPSDLPIYQHSRECDAAIAEYYKYFESLNGYLADGWICKVNYVYAGDAVSCRNVDESDAPGSSVTPYWLDLRQMNGNQHQVAQHLYKDDVIKFSGRIVHQKSWGGEEDNSRLNVYPTQITIVSESR